jgi:hypothetical protein
VAEQPIVPEYVLEDYYEAPTTNMSTQKKNDQRHYSLEQAEDDVLFLFLFLFL